MWKQYNLCTYTFHGVFVAWTISPTTSFEQVVELYFWNVWNEIVSIMLSQCHMFLLYHFLLKNHHQRWVLRSNRMNAIYYHTAFLPSHKRLKDNAMDKDANWFPQNCFFLFRSEIVKWTIKWICGQWSMFMFVIYILLSINYELLEFPKDSLFL